MVTEMLCVIFKDKVRLKYEIILRTKIHIRFELTYTFFCEFLNYVILFIKNVKLLYYVIFCY